LTKYYLGDQNKENKMGRICGTHGKNAYKLWLEHLKGGDHLEDLYNDRIILKWILET
jgi:hypothetical protein